MVDTILNKIEEINNDDEVFPIVINYNFDEETERKRIREFLNNPCYKDDWDD